jgi:hypothetical protein
LQLIGMSILINPIKPWARMSQSLSKHSGSLSSSSDVALELEAYLRDLHACALLSLNPSSFSAYPCEQHERHGYPWVPTDQGLSHPRQVGPTCQMTCRPTCGPRRPYPHLRRPPQDLACKTRQDIRGDAMTLASPDITRY